MPSTTPCLWFDRQAEEAANFYVSVFPSSRINAVSRYGKGGPMPEGTALTVDFELDGKPFMALNGGPHFTFSPAISFVVRCETQEEVDRYWAALSAKPEAERCGWLVDRYGVSWQIVPTALIDIMKSADSGGRQRATAVMMTMKKLDIAALQRAFDGG